jgi:hypothetical protein
MTIVVQSITARSETQAMRRRRRYLRMRWSLYMKSQPRTGSAATRRFNHSLAAQALGTEVTRTGALKGRLNYASSEERSIPDILLVKFDAVLIQERTILILKRHRLMVFVLILHISPHVVQIRSADTERRVSALPGK